MPVVSRSLEVNSVLSRSRAMDASKEQNSATVCDHHQNKDLNTTVPTLHFPVKICEQFKGKHETRS